MKKKIVCIIQARLSSTRLPGKVLMDLEGKTVLERVLERVMGSRLISDVIVATTVNSGDLKIVELCSKNDFRVYRGSENDVLDRFFQAAKSLSAEHIVRVTSDCPLVDPVIIDKVIKKHLDEKSDYTSNILKETFPDGQDVEVFTFEALTKAQNSAKLLSEREHVTPFIRNNPRLFKLVNVESGRDLSSKRWTLDEENDYKFIKSVYKHFAGKNGFTMEDVLVFLTAHPELERINSGIIRNEGYFKSLKKDMV